MPRRRRGYRVLGIIIWEASGKLQARQFPPVRPLFPGISFVLRLRPRAGEDCGASPSASIRRGGLGSTWIRPFQPWRAARLSAAASSARPQPGPPGSRPVLDRYGLWRFFDSPIWRLKPPPLKSPGSGDHRRPRFRPRRPWLRRQPATHIAQAALPASRSNRGLLADPLFAVHAAC